MPTLSPGVLGRHLLDVSRHGLRQRLPLMPLAESAESALLRSRLRALRRHEDSVVAALTHEAPSGTAQVAVVIATFRRRDLLRAAVGSALAQTVGDLQVIVVDDGGGATDGLPADPRLTVVAMPANTRNLAMVRNVGIRLTSSTYLAFLDDDNTWAPEHLELALATLATGPDLSYSSVELVDPDGTRLRVEGQAWSRPAMSHRNHVDASSIVVRRAPEVRFSLLPRHRGGWRMEDWELVWRLSARWTVAHVDRATVRYLVNPDSYYSRVDNQRG